MPSHKKNLTSDSSASKQSSYNIPKPKENRESKSHRKGSLTTQKPDYNYGSRGMKTRLKMYPKHITQIPSVQRIDEEPGSFQSSGSSNTNNTEISHSQDSTFGSILSLSSMSTSMGTMFSRTSLSTNVERFRSDFEEFKCKMVIFGESLSLCNCIASDFKKRLTFMERRLKGLEKEQTRIENNYFDIIQKNKKLTNKTKELVHKLQMCGTEEEMREVAGRICKNYLHGAWKTVEPADLDFRRISGGLSNFLYYVALPDDTSKMRGRTGSNTSVTDRQYSEIVGDEPKQVLLRIYGQVHGERAMDAIVTESVIFTLLSERRLGPKLHGVFSGGRIEEFIHARPLLTKELGEPAFSMKIAEKTAAIHSMEVPLSKEPYWMWKTMNKWLKTVKEERLANGVKGKNEEENEIIKRLKTIEFEKEIEWLKKFLATVDSPVVFCHNDLQEGNILLVEDEPTTTDEYETSFEQTFPSMTSPVTSQTHDVIGEAGGRSAHASLASIGVDDDRPSMPRTPFVQRSQPFIEHEDANTSDSIHSHISDSGEPRLVLIDFEYCAYNYRGFDIANHFQEWGYDYTNPDHPFYYENQENTPTLEQKEIFIKEYLKHYNANLSDDKEMVPPSIESVNKLLNEVEAFTLASHLFWTLWSIVNASKSQIPFGYWEYGISRLDNFLRLKQEIIKKDKCGLAQKRKICEVDI